MKDIILNPRFGISGNGTTTGAGWGEFKYAVLAMSAFWGAVFIKAAIVWIIWWWFYYGKNGGLKSKGGGYNGLPSSAFRDPGRIVTNLLDKEDHHHSSFQQPSFQNFYKRVDKNKARKAIDYILNSAEYLASKLVG